MSSISVRLEEDTDQLLERLKSMQNVDKAGIMNAIAEGLRTSTEERFQAQETPEGVKWKESRRAREKGGKTLIRTSDLRTSIKTEATGYITIYREEFDGTLLISKGHMFKTLPDINGREYKFYAVEDTVIDAGEQVGKVLVEAEKSGTDYNLPAGKITVSMIHLGGVSSVTNEVNWLYQEGAEVESIESLRERTMDAFEEAAERTTDAKIKNAAKTVPGVLNVEIDSQHPRGQGTVDIIVTSSAGEATETLLRKVEQAVEYLKGNYDDFLCRSATIVRQDIDLTIYLSKDVSTSGVKEQAEYIIENTLKLTDREDMNCLYLDSIRVALASGISDYRKSVISKPNTDIELNKGNVILLGNLNVQVTNVGGGESGL